MILPKLSLKNCLKYAEKLCGRLARTPCFYQDKKIDYTVSIGISSLNRSKSLDSLLREADQALYEAKRSGRNRVCFKTTDKVYNNEQGNLVEGHRNTI